MKAGFFGCGAGLLAKGMEDAGIEAIFGIDSDNNAYASFCKNFPNADVFLMDVRRIEQDGEPESLALKKLREADVWAVTLPCQTFSHANQKRKENPELLYYALYLIAHHKPKYWFIENVPNAAKWMPKVADVKVFSMAQFGNKQQRKRMFWANFDLGFIPHGTHSEPAVTKSGNGNARVYGYTDLKTALRRMGFEGKGLKLCGNQNEQKAQLGEGVVYEFAYFIGKQLKQLEEVKRPIPPTAKAVGILGTFI